MKNLLSAFTFAISVFILTACAASGVKVDDNKVEAFKIGVTTKAQVLEALGPPTSQHQSSDGTTMLSYTYAEASTRPSTFIPFAGPFVGGMDSSAQSVSLRFNRAGKLTGIEKSSMESGANMGASRSEDNRRK